MQGDELRRSKGKPASMEAAQQKARCNERANDPVHTGLRVSCRI